jgi:hypothetical protein
MVASAAVPAVLSQAVDDGVVGGDRTKLLRWCLVLAVVAVVQASAGDVRHRTACRLHYGTTAALSAELTARVHDPAGGTGEGSGRLTSLLTSDAPRVGTVVDLQRDRAELAASTEDVLDGLLVLHGLGTVDVALQRANSRI